MMSQQPKRDRIDSNILILFLCVFISASKRSMTSIKAQQEEFLAWRRELWEMQWKCGGRGKLVVKIFPLKIFYSFRNKHRSVSLQHMGSKNISEKSHRRRMSQRQTVTWQNITTQHWWPKFLLGCTLVYFLIVPVKTIPIFLLEKSVKNSKLPNLARIRIDFIIRLCT